MENAFDYTKDIALISTADDGDETPKEFSPRWKNILMNKASFFKHVRN
jgi:hypothetical protein